MVCDRLICNFAIIGVRMNAGIDQPSIRFLKGHVVLRGLDLCCCCVRCRAEKSVANSSKVGCLHTFFLSEEIIDLCGDVYKIFTKPGFYFQFVGLCRLP